MIEALDQASYGTASQVADQQHGELEKTKICGHLKLAGTVKRSAHADTAADRYRKAISR
ncbi:hypothetical protein DGWBC_0685 [Dehalogenimonas sp. WBC-2]|nr:hypothetical protein DGWBC_0685 [Dehalogenimonas sp. WBC-2]